MFVHELMTREPATVTGDTRVQTAVDLLVQLRVSSLPVVDAVGRIRGVVSEIDLIRDAMIPDPGAHLVSEVMSSPAVTVHEHDDLAEVLGLMAGARLKSLPVVDNEKLVVGIISRSDVLREQARAEHDVPGDVRGDVHAQLRAVGHVDRAEVPVEVPQP